MIFQEALNYLRPAVLRAGSKLGSFGTPLWNSNAQHNMRTTVLGCCLCADSREIIVLAFNLRDESIFLSRHWSPNLHPAGTSCMISPQTEQAAQPQDGGARTEMVVTDGQTAPACLWVTKGQYYVLSTPGGSL